MNAQAPASASKSWIRTVAVYLSAALFSATLLPATLAGWYYADRESLASAIGTAIDYAAPVR
jgi:hypothetical protein